MTDSPDAVAEIKRLYYETTRSTIARDLPRAIALLKSLPTEEDRERVAVYMDGLAEMRREWASARGTTPGSRASAGPARGRRPGRAPGPRDR